MKSKKKKGRNNGGNAGKRSEKWGSVGKRWDSRRKGRDRKGSGGTGEGG